MEMDLMKKKKKKGFTLIELIVVIAILGILAAIAIPRFGGVQTNAANRAHAANIRTLESAAALAVASDGIPTVTVTWTTSAAAVPATTYSAGNPGTHLASTYLQGNGPAIPAGATLNPNGAAITAGHTRYQVVITASTGAITTTTIAP